MEEVEIREKKKGHGLAVFLLCLAFLLIGAGLMYYYLIVYISRGSTNNNTNAGVEILNTNGALVNSLIDRMDYNDGCGINIELYKKHKSTVSSLDKNYVKALIAKEANGKNISNTITFTKEQFENATKTLFGNQIVLSDENISTCPGIVFDSINQKYVGDPNACTINCPTITNVRYVIKAEKDSKGVYIYVAVASINEESKKVSNPNDLGSVIEGVDSNTFNISKDYTKVNNYKYTFEYDSTNNNYLFKNIEIFKDSTTSTQ